MKYYTENFRQYVKAWRLVRSKLTTQLSSVTKENKQMRETILDLQPDLQCEGQYTVVFSGIPEQPSEDPKNIIKDFMVNKIKTDIAFHRVHHLGGKHSPE